MSSPDDDLNDVLGHVNPSKRAFLRTLVAGAGFAVPTVVSFSMKGISTYVVHAQGGSNVSIIKGPG